MISLNKKSQMNSLSIGLEPSRCHVFGGGVTPNPLCSSASRELLFDCKVKSGKWKVLIQLSNSCHCAEAVGCRQSNPANFYQTNIFSNELIQQIFNQKLLPLSRWRGSSCRRQRSRTNAGEVRTDCVKYNQFSPEILTFETKFLKLNFNPLQVAREKFSQEGGVYGIN
jgi:hypothetical protein